MTTVAAPHQVQLTHNRRVLFDRDGDVWRVAFYWPQEARARLRELAVLANRGDLEACRRLRELPQRRAVAKNTDLRTAVEIAASEYDARRAAGIARQVAELAERCGWL